MSNTHLDREKGNYDKIIKVRPIEFFQQPKYEENDSSSLDKENARLQKKIQHAEKQLTELKQQKTQLLNDTNEKIKQAKINWDQEKNTYIEQANKEGYSVGFTLGKETGMSEYEKLIEQANLITQSATKDYHSVVEKSEQKIVDIAIYTAEKIIKQKITADPNSFLKIVTKAVKEITDQSSVSIYLHPNNYTDVLKQKNELAEALDGDTKISIYIDQNIDKYGCMIKHSFGQIDASVHTQLEQIHDALSGIYLESKSNEPN